MSKAIWHRTLFTVSLYSVVFPWIPGFTTNIFLSFNIDLLKQGILINQLINRLLPRLFNSYIFIEAQPLSVEQKHRHSMKETYLVGLDVSIFKLMRV